MDDFARLDLAVGRITDVQDFPQARVPAYKLTIDFGTRGTRRASAQIAHYDRAELVGRDVVCVLGLAPKRVAGFVSEVLVLGALSDADGVVLLRPDRPTGPGSPIA
jgi:tRNA-binding protein